MQELRLVAVSEDGTYLVLASTGRGTRFMLPVDDRLRAAVRGQFSRLGQYEIEVENPLRPKEIQARIRSGENAEAISEYSGIPLERVRWFESPVLQEREYMAQQAQHATLRRQGDASPGPPLGEIITERIGAQQLETGDAVWDSWKREDNTWQLTLTFQVAGENRVANWVYDPRRRSVTPADEEAGRLCGPDTPEPLDLGPGSANVTPFVPRRQGGSPAESGPAPISPVTPTPTDASPASGTPLRSAPWEPSVAPGLVSATPQHDTEPSTPPRHESEDARESVPTAEPVEPVAGTVAEPPLAEASEPPAARTPASSASRVKEHQEPQERTDHPRQREAPIPAAAAGTTSAANGGTQPKRKGRGRRASVPSWDEIMFGSKKTE